MDASDSPLDGARALADQIGVHALTIRRLADALDTKPMTIYHHLPSKDAILDGMVDRVFAQIDQPPTHLGWKLAIRHRCLSAREVLSLHPWAAPLMESRTNPGPETLGHHDAVLGCLRRGGLSFEMMAHAHALLDSYDYGFALQEANLPAAGGTEMADLAGTLIEPLPDGAFPHLTDSRTTTSCSRATTSGPRSTSVSTSSTMHSRDWSLEPTMGPEAAVGHGIRELQPGI